MTLAVTSDVPGVTANEIIFSLQNVKCSKVSNKDGIITELEKIQQKNCTLS